MQSRERVQAALARRPVDRVPVFMWFHPRTTRVLAQVLNVPAAVVGDVMGNDIHQTWVGNNHATEGVVHTRDGESHVDAWGIEWTRQYWYNQITRHPLARASRQEVMAFSHPYDKADEFLRPMDRLMAASDGYFVGCDVSPCGFEMAWRLMGMERMLSAMVSDQPLARAVLRGCADFARQLAAQACRRFDLDWLWTGDDVASQQGMMVSPAMWRNLVKPELARVVTVGRDNVLPVAFHCCGALRPIIPDLIEIGVSVLNPVQSSCPGMDPLELKAEFGADLAFMGGVDTQDLLPNRGAGEVRSATEGLIRGMTEDGGGYILAASHSIPPETPLTNIFAMYQAAGIEREEIDHRAAAARRAASRQSGCD